MSYASFMVPTLLSTHRGLGLLTEDKEIASVEELVRYVCYVISRLGCQTLINIFYYYNFTHGT